jgi:hypothetical protein
VVVRAGRQASFGRISSSSGKRPTACFEKRMLPSATTSNCPLPPGVVVTWIPVLASISAARLAARVSYPLQVGQ